ncbi:MAG TPA: cache domain-containing protein [Myxococcaceae bacterium]|nr:cache domain-containing protein [Myxococcaceae bacterium]
MSTPEVPSDARSEETLDEKPDAKPDEKALQRRRIAWRVLWVATAASAVLSALVIGSVLQAGDRLRLTARDKAQTEAMRFARQLDDTLQQVEPRVRALVQDVGSGSLTDAELKERLAQTLEGDAPYLFEAGVAFSPYTHDPKRRLFGPHYSRLDGVSAYYQREDLGDYVQTSWFRSAVTRGLGWNEPEIGHSSGELLIGVSAPFFLPGSPRVPAGVVRVNASINRLRDAVSSLTAGRARYGYLLSPLGIYLSHPDTTYVDGTRTVFQVAEEAADRALGECARKALAGGAAYTDGRSELTQRPSWVFCQPLTASGWALVSVVEQADVIVLPQALWRDHVLALLSLLLTAALLTCVAFRLPQPSVARIWGASCCIGVLFAGGTAYLWHRLSNDPVPLEGSRQEIFDRAELEAFQRQHATVMQNLKQVDVRHIPAGIYLSTLRFSATNEAVVTGYVWQRYRVGVDDEVSRGFVLPDAEQVTFQEAYRRRTADEEVVGWNFRATLRQQLGDTSRYPFDSAALRIRLWHKDFDRNYRLSPDLGAYTLLIPEARPGLTEHLSLPGWKVQQTFFDYQVAGLGSNFGMRGFAGQRDSPELCFTLVAKRELVDAFFASLMPILGVSFILFSLMVCWTNDDKKRDRLGFKPMSSLSVASGMLFVVLVAQTNMRSRVGTSEIMFFEHLYFMAYATIILVAGVALLSARAHPLRALDYEDNLLAKVSFWPVVVGSWLGLTVLSFY